VKSVLTCSIVEVNDGEAGEATIVSVRAKVFHHDKEVGWKERGAGMLKINVPENCLDYDALGVPIPGSFDASGLEPDAEDGESGGDGPKVARLILRQDQTHRVILNTAIVPAMNFQEKASLKSVGIIFTAFEGEEAKPVNITVKVSYLEISHISGLRAEKRCLDDCCECQSIHERNQHCPKRIEGTLGTSRNTVRNTGIGLIFEGCSTLPALYLPRNE
jgi:hypothetical protein